MAGSTIKILHIDPDYKVTYFIKHPGGTIRSYISLEKALELLKTEEFNLIISEPHSKAILKPQDNAFNTEKKMRILIVDDNPILREGLRSVLLHSPSFEVVGEAADGLEAIDSVKKLYPDLILMDLSLPRMDGIAATREIKEQRPETKVLVFTIHDTPDYREAALKAGADGYVIKDSSRAELIQAIQSIL